jgi:hypothetical protein
VVVFNTRQNRQLYNQLDMETPLPPISYSRFSSWHPKNGPSGCFPTSIAAAFAAPQAAQTDRVITGKKKNTFSFFFFSHVDYIHQLLFKPPSEKKRRSQTKQLATALKGQRHPC